MSGWFDRSLVPATLFDDNAKSAGWFDDSLLRPAVSGGTTFNQSALAVSAASTNILRSITENLLALTAPTNIFIRQINNTKNATSNTARSLAKSNSNLFNATSNTARSLFKNTNGLRKVGSPASSGSTTATPDIIVSSSGATGATVGNLGVQD